tara:strand:+ start:18892 stop:19722 length:831 start_codon:yes stop_codon:yes gene_type:complete
MQKIKNKFSVIMPVYFQECPNQLRAAIESIVNQTLIPNEIIIVLDGPVGENLHEVIDEFKTCNLIKVIKLDTNSGVGVARKKAIEIAHYDILALMDSDDISCKDRFEKQISKILSQEANVVGGWIEEFDKEPHDTGIIRKSPVTHDEIYKYGKWRMPVNNVTLMFTREVYNDVGGYSDQSKSEDWNLIVRFLANGVKFYNFPEILVNVRAGQDMFLRRRGWTQVFSQLYIFPLMYKLKYIGLFHLIANVSIRLLLRLMPISLTSYLYRNFLRQKIS